MALTHVFGGVPVRDRAAAVSWYTQLVGHPPDLSPNDEEAAWRLTETGWLYVVVDAERAGTALHTLLVDDLDAFVAGLSERGIEAEPIESLGDAVRRTLVTDPDGNRLNVGEPLG
ncbi:MAG TPA: VOC family protein [Solirubrobacteraceae bacterium]|jgi:predicted enzyme related to lactoylglutathione lyase|nr:VOC family protein [Solirubrobacteraceae bacterium]